MTQQYTKKISVLMGDDTIPDCALTSTVLSFWKESGKTRQGPVKVKRQEGIITYDKIPLGQDYEMTIKLVQ